METTQKIPQFAEVVGWYGTFAIVLAYVLVSFDVIAASGVTYQLLNLSGAGGIIVIAWYKKVKQSIALNVFWSLIAIVALLKALTN